MTTRELDPFVVPAEHAEISDDPFARAATPDPGAAAAEASVSVIGPLARRDPNAPVESSTEFELTGATSFDDLLRRARWRGFLAGAGAGALAVVVGAIALSWLTSPPPARFPARPLADEVRAPPPPLPVAPEVRPPAAAALPAFAEGRPARAAGKRRDPVPRAVEAAPALVPPGMVLRPSEEPAAGPDAPPARPAAPTPEPAARQLEDSEVAAALDARRSTMDGCIAAHPADVADARGRQFHLVVTVDQTGRVARARLDDADLGATALGACLVRLARELRFDAFDGEPVRVELPLRLADE